MSDYYLCGGMGVFLGSKEDWDNSMKAFDKEVKERLKEHPSALAVLFKLGHIKEKSHENKI